MLRACFDDSKEVIMSPIITYTLTFFMGLYALIILIELIISRTVKRFLIELAILFGVLLLLKVAPGFPTPKIGFGEVPPLATIDIMFVCLLLGITANYFFFLKAFS